MSVKPLGTTGTQVIPQTQKPSVGSQLAQIGVEALKNGLGSQSASSSPTTGTTPAPQTPPNAGTIPAQQKKITIGQNEKGDLQITLEAPRTPATATDIPSFKIGTNPSPTTNEAQNTTATDKKLDITI